MYANMKRMNNEMAVSPIVATLVLIVVAVIGAVAVGTIMGTFSSDVSKQASAGQASTASQTQLTIAGSTTIQPAMQLVANDFMAANPGYKISVQGGGSGAGVSSVAQGVADIGMFSQAWDSTMAANYPTIKAFPVGYGGVVAIVNGGTTITQNVSTSDLNLIFSNGKGTGATDSDLTGITTVETRSDTSGTADSFGSYIGDANIYSTTNGQIGNNGNGKEVTAVGATASSIGFTDLDYALSSTANIKVLDYIGTPFPTAYTQAGEQNAVNGVTDAQHFPKGATRILNLLTNGAPTSVQQALLNFAASPGEASQFTSINLTPISAVSKVD